jgi:hypothetical protein
VIAWTYLCSTFAFKWTKQWLLQLLAARFIARLPLTPDDGEDLINIGPFGCLYFNPNVSVEVTTAVDDVGPCLLRSYLSALKSTMSTAPARTSTKREYTLQSDRLRAPRSSVHHVHIAIEGLSSPLSLKHLW